MSRLRDALQLVAQTYEAGLDARFVEDIAFLGNASGALYAWDPSPIVDLDVVIFFDELGPEAAGWLRDVESRLSRMLAEQGIAFESRIVNGPYKRTAGTVTNPVITAHLGVFTERTYADEAPLLRWSWRKYACHRDPARLKRGAPARPSVDELLDGPRGLRERLRCLERAEATFWERQLPSFDWVAFAVTPDDDLFTEYCFAAGADSARNHARVVGHVEADQLPNAEFFPWYQEHVLRSPALERLFALKQRARQVGYAGMGEEAHALATDYLRRLCAHLT